MKTLARPGEQVRPRPGGAGSPRPWLQGMRPSPGAPGVRREGSRGARQEAEALPGRRWRGLQRGAGRQLGGRPGAGCTRGLLAQAQLPCLSALPEKGPSSPAAAAPGPGTASQTPRAQLRAASWVAALLTTTAFKQISRIWVFEAHSLALAGQPCSGVSPARWRPWATQPFFAVTPSPH